MPETINIQEYLTEGVEAIVKDALRATLRDPKESLFMARFAAASRKASERRARNEKDGLLHRFACCSMQHAGSDK